MKEIYLDNAATTPVYPEVLKEMAKASYGNPNSLHSLGDKAADAMNNSRKKLAKEIGAKDHEIIFTSGATESNNLALKGLWKLKKRKVVISAIEHSSVIAVGNFLRKMKVDVVEIPVSKEGKIDLKLLEKSIDKNTAVVSIMHVNNEIGSINDIASIGKMCEKYDALFHTDVVQSLGKMKIDVNKMKIDLLSASSHKIGGPKGVGLLYVRSGVPLSGLIQGGGQERGLRSGTQNVPGIVGFAKALEIFKKKEKAGKVKKLRKKLINGLTGIGGKINSPEDGSPWIVNASFPVEGETAVVFLSKSGVLVSTGSACSSKKKAESKTLRELGLNKEEIAGSIRFSLSSSISEKAIDKAVQVAHRVFQKNKIA